MWTGMLHREIISGNNVLIKNCINWLFKNFAPNVNLFMLNVRHDFKLMHQ